jgi:hypothetical protein
VRDCVADLRTEGRTGSEGEDQRAAIGFIEGYVAFEAGSSGRQHQVHRRATEADEKVVIIGIDHGRPSTEVGFDPDRSLQEAKAPRLRVVPARRQGRVSHEIAQLRLGRERRALARDLEVVRFRRAAPRETRRNRPARQQSRTARCPASLPSHQESAGRAGSVRA